MGHIPDYDTPIYNSMLADWEIELLGGDPKDPLWKAEFLYKWEDFIE